MQSLSLVNVIFIMLLRDQLQYKYQYITFTSHRETFQRILSRILESGEEAEKLVYMKLPDSYSQIQPWTVCKQLDQLFREGRNRTNTAADIVVSILCGSHLFGP